MRGSCRLLVALGAVAVTACGQRGTVPSDGLPPPRRSAAEQQAAKSGEAVVRVAARHGERGSSATGFVVGACVVATAAHAVPRGWMASVITRAPDRHRLRSFVLWRDLRHDVLLLRVPGLRLESLDLSRDAPRPMPAAVAGFPMDGPFVVRNVVVGAPASIASIAGGRSDATAFRGRMAPGLSGAPLVDRRGKVIGLVVATTAGDDVSYAASVDALRGALGHAGRTEALRACP